MSRNQAEQKFDNFKQFVKEISKNEEIIQEYQEMSFFKLQALAMVFLIPNREHLDSVIPKMQEKLNFEDKHIEKFKRYIEFFIEYISGETPNSEYFLEKTMSKSPDISNLSYEEQLDYFLEKK